MSRWLPLIAGCALLCAAVPAAAFRFSDGAAGTCMAKGVKVSEYAAQPDDPAVKGRVGLAAPDGDGWIIVWNVERQQALPAAMRDFLFFHECAHARLNSMDEAAANCQGLVDMRAAGRAGPEVEAKLAAFYGEGNSYWIATVKCADAKAAAK